VVTLVRDPICFVTSSAYYGSSAYREIKARYDRNALSGFAKTKIRNRHSEVIRTVDKGDFVSSDWPMKELLHCWGRQTNHFGALDHVQKIKWSMDFSSLRQVLMNILYDQRIKAGRRSRKSRRVLQTAADVRVWVRKVNDL